MAFNVTDVLGNFRFEGARATLFNVDILNPVDSSADSSVQFLASSTQIPAMNLGNITVPYFGRVINFAGDRTYDSWTVKIMNDEDFAVRNALETWSDAINQKVGNVRVQPDYKSTARVTQWSKTGDILRVYRFHGIYPSAIAPIGLDWASTNQFETFDVTFMYDYWDIENNTTGNAGGA